jgi:hypothetical protein
MKCEFDMLRFSAPGLSSNSGAQRHTYIPTYLSIHHDNTKLSGTGIKAPGSHAEYMVAYADSTTLLSNDGLELKRSFCLLTSSIGKPSVLQAKVK